ncbi:hypothetical protein IRJ41_018413 [Triplophysa rosa]|uniref:LINE-1 type transposase domain-containing protein 1 ES cell-associated protein 11 n=1 Tax=Triplophysa rosa TaxID=992332 RepID=A0A9W7THZ1_TRIRA|nr:hypothetical protein IRJ41_018413 [Triplophysa rosa]
MSLENFWGSSLVKMPEKSARKIAEKKDGAAPHEDDQSGDQAALTSRVATDLSPEASKVVESLTANIAKMIDSKLELILEKIQDVSKEVQSTNNRVEEAEQRISGLENVATGIESRVTQIEKTIASLTERLDDQENRGRRRNLRIIGLPEKTEGQAAVNFMEKWIPDILCLKTKNGRVKLERAHRIGAPGSERYTRSIIVRFHNFVDRQRVMDAARQLKEVRFEGKRIYFFQDFSAETQRKRRGFDEARKRLRDMGLRYSLTYPAALRITADNSVKVFNSPEKAMAFIDALRCPAADASDVSVA